MQSRAEPKYWGGIWGRSFPPPPCTAPNGVGGSPSSFLWGRSLGSTIGVLCLGSTIGVLLWGHLFFGVPFWGHLSRVIPWGYPLGSTFGGQPLGSPLWGRPLGLCLWGYPLGSFRGSQPMAQPLGSSPGSSIGGHLFGVNAWRSTLWGHIFEVNFWGHSLGPTPKFGSVTPNGGHPYHPPTLRCTP